MQVQELMSTAAEMVEWADDVRRVEDLMVSKKLRHVPEKGIGGPPVPEGTP